MAKKPSPAALAALAAMGAGKIEVSVAPPPARTQGRVMARRKASGKDKENSNGKAKAESLTCELKTTKKRSVVEVAGKPKEVWTDVPEWWITITANGMTREVILPEELYDEDEAIKAAKGYCGVK